MIRRLEGTVVEKNVDNLVISCGGVGYKVWLTGGDLGNINPPPTPLILHTYHAIREDSQDLYGFKTTNDRAFFELLITVSGIGPKTALGLLNTAGVDVLRRGILSGDPTYLSKTSGIGKKTAEKIVFELSEKIPHIDGHDAVHPEHHDTIDALISLGYDERSVRKILKDLPAGSQKEQIKQAIALLSKK